jgi:Na+/proline symporter
MNAALAPIDWLIIGAYLVVSLGVGVLFMRRSGASTGEYFVSGRRLPWWLAGTSMVATSFASDTPLYVTGLVRTAGIARNWEWWAFAVGGMFSVFVFARLWRRAAVVTDAELTELRYSGRAAAALRGVRAAYFALPINCIAIGWATLGMATFLRIVFGVSPAWAILAAVAAAAAYAILSGLWGVVVTDLPQFVIAMAGAVVLCVKAMQRFGGGAILAASARARSPLGADLLRFFPRLPDRVDLSSADFWSGSFVAFCVFISVLWWANKNADGGNVVIQRMLASKDERHAVLATLWFNVANYALRPWPWILVAVASVAVFPRTSETGTEAEAAYPEMVREFLPAGLLGLMVASFLGAYMSTVDSLLNSSSAYVVNDLYRRFIRPEAPERHYVMVSRLASLGFMGAAAIVAWQADSIRQLFRFLLTFSAGVGLVYILRWFWWRVNAWSEIVAMAASAVLGTGLILFQERHGLPFPVPLFITVMGSTAAWLAATFVTRPTDEDRLVTFYRRVRPYGAWGPVAARAGVRRARGLGRLLLAWVAGTIMVLAAMIGVGKLLLDQRTIVYDAGRWGIEIREGWVYLVIALFAAAVVIGEVHRLGRRDDDEVTQ